VRRYEAFTLVEMIIVLVVMIILFTIGARTFQSLSRANAVHEATVKITQDIRSAQRSAMMLERNPDERWLYGIGIDFRGITNPINPSYTIFKYCAAENYFDAQNLQHASSVPVNTLEPPNFTAEVNCTAGFASPMIGRNTIEVVEIKEFGYLQVNFDTDIRFILFESVSGKAFLYQDSPPKLSNYNPDFSIFPVDTISPLRIVIGGNIGPDRAINVHPVSGIIFVENVMLR
jgi:type II secretory pathway pseudopilin PulG